MAVVLSHNSYGKSQVRLTRLDRHADRHDLKEIAVDIRLEGDFAASYLTGDNSQVVATDSMKNTVYVLAKEHGVTDIEAFAQVLARHFLATYAHVSASTIAVTDQPWQRLLVDGREHPHAFAGGGGARDTCIVTATRQGLRFESGFEGLLLLKTTASSFTGFVRDRYTTLPETSDRIFATLLAATWLYRDLPADPHRIRQLVRQVMLDVFAGHDSLAVQQTLHAMGAAALDACPEIEEVRLQMPNKHRIRVDLQPFGLDNANEIFVPTDEPFGLITGVLQRADVDT